MYYALRNLVAKIIVGNEKAVIAFMVAFIVTQAAHRGFTLDMSKQQALGNLLAALVAHLVVYLTPNSKSQ